MGKYFRMTNMREVCFFADKIAVIGDFPPTIVQTFYLYTFSVESLEIFKKFHNCIITEFHLPIQYDKKKSSNKFLFNQIGNLYTIRYIECYEMPITDINQVTGIGRFGIRHERSNALFLNLNIFSDIRIIDNAVFGKRLSSLLYFSYLFLIKKIKAFYFIKVLKTY